MRPHKLESMPQVAGLNFPATVSTSRYGKSLVLFWQLVMYGIVLLVYYSSAAARLEPVGVDEFTRPTLLAALNLAYVLFPCWLFYMLAKRGLVEKVCTVSYPCRLQVRALLSRSAFALIAPILMMPNLILYLLGKNELWGISDIIFFVASPAETIVIGVLHFACVVLWLWILDRRVALPVEADNGRSGTVRLLLIDRRAWAVGMLSVGYHAFACLAISVRWLAS